MIYSPRPPYEIRQNRLIDFATMQRLRRFARTWDLVGNSGRFVETIPLFWTGGASPFGGFMRFSDWFHAREGRLHGIALPRLVEAVFIWLTQERGLSPPTVAGTLGRDAQRAGWAEWPATVKAHLPAAMTAAGSPARANSGGTTRRQERHRGVGAQQSPSIRPKPVDQAGPGPTGVS
jgi:hypothetical protein